MADELEIAFAYNVHHWECPYCGCGFEDEADLPETFECNECGQTMQIKQ